MNAEYPPPWQFCDVMIELNDLVILLDYIHTYDCTNKFNRLSQAVVRPLKYYEFI